MSSAIRRVLLAAFIVLILPRAADAQGWPAKPITLVVPFAAGGPTDVMGRLVAEHMGRTLGAQFVIENVAGAGGTAGAERVAKADPDGHTLLIHHSGLSAAPSLYASLRYDARTAFDWVGLINSNPMTMVAKKTVEAKSLKELLDWLKANADTVTLGHAGIGSGSHVCGLILQQAIGAKFRFVAYRGTGPAMNDLVGGQIDAMCDQATNAIPQITAGTIKSFAVTGETRLPAIKDVPTTKEAGVPAFSMVLFNALYAPKGTPVAVLDALNGALVKAIEDTAMQERFTALGCVLFPANMRSREAHGRYFLADIDRQAGMFKAAGIEPGKAN